MAKPDFICIGAQRSGTSLLHTILDRHPDVFVPNTGKGVKGKELHFFNNRIHVQGLADYEADFDSAGSDVRAVGEITPAYAALSKAIVREVRRCLGSDLKIIYVLRDPVDRVLSHYKMAKTQFGQVKAHESTIDDRAIARFCNNEGCVRRTRYGKTLRVWEEVFGRDQVLIVRYESLVSDPVREMRRVFSFLGVTPDHAEFCVGDFERIHSSTLKADVTESARGYLEWRWRSQRVFLRRVAPTDGEESMPGKLQLPQRLFYAGLFLRHMQVRVRTWSNAQVELMKIYLRLRLINGGGGAIKTASRLVEKIPTQRV